MSVTVSPLSCVTDEEWADPVVASVAESFDPVPSNVAMMMETTAAEDHHATENLHSTSVVVRYMESSREVMSIAGPALLTQMLRYSCNLISTVYCGHTLDSSSFGAVATGLSFTMLTALSIGAGIASALDTLSTQAYGKQCCTEKQQHTITSSSVSADDDDCGSPSSSPPSPSSSHRQAAQQGKFLRQSLVVTYAVYIPIAFLYFLCGPLIRMVVDHDMASMVVEFLQWSWFIVVPMLATNNVIKFAQSQCEPMVGFHASLMGAATLLPIFLVVEPRTVGGVVLCLGCNRWATLGFVLVLVRRNEKLVASWGQGGWSQSYEAGELDAANLIAFFQIGLPSLVANCADTWSFELMSIIAASLGPVASSTWSVLMTIYGGLFAGFVGLANAASVKVGNAIGKGSCSDARLHATTALSLTAIAGCILGAMLYVFGYHAFALIQSNPVVSEQGSVLLHLGGFTFLLDVVFYVMQGVYRGIGRQKQCAISVFIGMWIVALPASMLFTKIRGDGVFGLVAGLTCGLMVSTPLQFFVLFYSIDWGECVLDALRRHHITVGTPLPQQEKEGNEARQDDGGDEVTDKTQLCVTGEDGNVNDEQHE